MCDAVGSAPVEEDIPIEYDDLKLETKEAITAYNLLCGRSQAFGRDFSNVEAIFNILDIDKKDREIILSLMLVIDNENIKSESVKFENGRQAEKHKNKS